MSSLLNQTSGVFQEFMILEARFERPNTVTEHPVDREADVTDHVQIRPNRIVLRAALSETSIDGRFGGALGAIRFLEEAQGQPLTLVLDNEGIFRDLFLENEIDARTVVRGREYRISLKQIRRAFSETVGIIAPAQTTDPGAASRSDRGQQATQTRDISFARQQINNIIAPGDNEGAVTLSDRLLRSFGR